MTNPTQVLSKPVKCGWGNTKFKHDNPAICEAQSLTGKWTPCCKTCLARKQRSQDRNPWSALFPLNTRPLEVSL